MRFLPLPRARFERSSVVAAVLSALWLLSWFLLWRWYSLHQWLDTPFYALDKIPGHFTSFQVRATGVLFLSLSFIHIIGCVWLAKSSPLKLKRTPKISLGIAFGGACVVAIFMQPIGAVDVFYYLCQLKLHFFYDQNPYLTPFSPLYESDPFAEFSPFLGAIVVYGPAWFLVSWPATAISGFASVFQALVAYKIWSALFVLVSTLIIYRYCETRAQRILGAALFGLNPLVWYEAVGNAHNDIMMTAFLLAAVWAAHISNAIPATEVALAVRKPAFLSRFSRRRNVFNVFDVASMNSDIVTNTLPLMKSRVSRKPVWLQRKQFWPLTLPFLMIAILIKPTCAPLLWVFVIWLWRSGWTCWRFLASGALALMVACVAFAPFWAGGAMLAGWQNGIASSVNFSTGSLVSIAREWLQARGTEDGTLMLIRPVLLQWLVFITLVSPWIIRHFEHNLAVVLAAFYLLAGSLFSWYLLPIIAVLSLRPNRVSCWYILIASTLALQFNVMSVWAWFNSPFAGQPLQIHIWESVILALPLLLLTIASLRFWRPRRLC